jgi:hypothetical protein
MKLANRFQCSWTTMIVVDDDMARGGEARLR